MDILLQSLPNNNFEPTINVLFKNLALIIAAISGLIAAVGVVMNNVKTNKVNENVKANTKITRRGNALTKIGNVKTDSLANDLERQKQLAEECAEKQKEMAVRIATLETEKREALKAKELLNQELLAKESLHTEYTTTINSLRVERDLALKEAESYKSELLTRAKIKTETDNLKLVKDQEFSIGSSDEVKVIKE